MRWISFGKMGLLAICCVAIGVTTALADEQTSPKPDGSTADLLAGPAVEVDWPEADRPKMMATKGKRTEAESDAIDVAKKQGRSARRFDGGRRGRGGAGDAQSNAGPIGDAMRKALREIGLSDDQAKTIRAEVQAFRKRGDTWRAEHKDELAALRARTKAARSEQDREALRVLMAEARELRQDAPKPAELMKKIEAALTVEQVAKLKELRKKYAREARQEMNRQRDGAQRDRQRPDGERKRRQLDL